MGEVLTKVRCPDCDSEHLVWHGIENHERQPDPDQYKESRENPAAVLHKWQCLHCASRFKERLE
jgi:transposase-like protein